MGMLSAPMMMKAPSTLTRELKRLESPRLSGISPGQGSDPHPLLSVMVLRRADGHVRARSQDTGPALMTTDATGV